jgi:hypothetical protein
MDELFRFVAMRPAKPADPDSAVQSRASADLIGVIADAATISERVRALAKWPVNGQLADYHFGGPMARFGTWAMANLLTADAANEQLHELTGSDAKKLSATKAFAADIASLDDTLLVLKYRSSGGSANSSDLQTARYGYDLVEQLAAEREPTLRHLLVPGARAPSPPPRPDPAPPPSPSDSASRRLSQVVAARAALRGAIRQGLGPLEAPAEPRQAADAAGAQPAPARATRGRAEAPSTSGAVAGGTPWHISEAAAQSMPRGAAATITGLAGDLRGTPAPILSARLADIEGDLRRTLALQDFAPQQTLFSVGSNLYGYLSPSQLAPGYGPLPVPAPVTIGQPGNLRPVGVGDLMIVRMNVKRYEGGEVGHIENVLRTEKLERDTRRLDRTEETVTTEVTTDKEEERDTQSTDRFSLKRETDSTVKTDAQVKAGLTVDAKYGPTVEIKADLQGSYQHQTEDVTKQSTEYSKDVVSRSVEKLSTKIRQLQTTITLQEFEERFSHGFDNTAPGGANVSGVYQFVDRISEAQIYNYGKRLLFDVMVPEPAAFYIWSQVQNTAAALPVQKPTDLTVTPSQLDGGNYQLYAQAYGATNIDPPPPEYVTVSQAWDATVAGDPHLFDKSAVLNLTDGYSAIQAAASGAWNYPDGQTPFVALMVGSNQVNLTVSGGPISLSGEEGTLPVGLHASHINSVTVTLEVLLESTQRVWEVWQEKAYAAIADAYKQRLSDYQHALAERQAAQAVAVGGRNPEANAAVMSAELRKSCIEQLTTQHFDLFGAVGSDTQGRPETDLGRLAIQGPFERFFEQAFEWERMTYFFYPYFWADKTTWAQRSLLDDSDDPTFADFLRAGGARVVFPVRPGFENAVIHYLETGLIWDGGDPPDISSSLYLPIVEEVAEAAQRPGDEVPVGDPWDVKVPTQLIKLRPDDALPTWKKVGQSWVPAN